MGIKNLFLLRIDKKWLNRSTSLDSILNNSLIDYLYYAIVDRPNVIFSKKALSFTPEVVELL